MDRKVGYPPIPTGTPNINEAILDPLALVNAPMQQHEYASLCLDIN